MVVWLDFEKGDSYKKEAKKQQEGKKPKFISAASVDQPINSSSVEISGGFNGKKGVEEAKQIAELLNAGSLPVDLKKFTLTLLVHNLVKMLLIRPCLHQL